ncbi:hypothetical protein KAF25_006899 [Fusarium avenaceum]|uniref:Uncharacterized protein n=1 Tax=Fusarium avenaceum TaxID=40199 RepID=A0A9P7KQG6_9HYPO|nr:hypothetical protein KAF25_006899 [Fusarium avenaceum]
MLFNNAIVVFALSVSVNAFPQPYPNKCGDQVCPANKAKCCEVIINGVAEIECFAECPPVQALQNREEPLATTAASPSIPSFGPKCGDSFFCPVDQVCCPDALYHCADPDKVSEQCPW